MVEKIAVIFLFVFGLCLVAELIWARRQQRQIFEPREAAINIGIYGVHVLIRPLTFGWTAYVYNLLTPLQPFTLPETAATFVLTLVATDLAYYWYHRFTHQWPILWTMHHTHHSSRKMNLTAAVRLNWIARFVTPLFFMPLLFLGLPPVWVFASLAIGLFYQFFLHTEAVGKLGRFEGILLNTPSAHRVHHGQNAHYLDKNYAGMLIVWDRLFGTYQAEDEASCYGVKGFHSNNPLLIQFHQLGVWLRGLKRPKAAPPPRPASDNH